MIVTAEREGYIGNTTTYFGKRHQLFDLAGGFNKINRIIVVFLNTGCNSKNVWIKNDILWIKTNLFSKNFISAVTDLHFTLFGISLSYFIKRHYNYSCTIGFTGKCLFNKLCFPFFHGDGVHDATALYTFQSGFNDLEFRAVDHDRDLGNVRFALNEVHESGHGVNTI